MSYTKQNLWCSAPATMTSAAQFGNYFNFAATASYRSRYIQLPKLPQKTSYSFSFDVTVVGISTYQNQVLMMDPETGTQIINITGGKFGAYSTNAGDLTAGTSQALSAGRHTVTVSISNDPLLLITITTSGGTPTTFEAVRSTNATVVNEFLTAMQHCPMMGVPYDLTNYTYYWRGYVIIKDMVITSGAETIFSAYETFAGDMKIADYSVASGTPQISGATLNMLTSGVPQFKHVFASDMDSFEIVTKMTFFKSVTYPAQAYRGGLFFLWQTPASGNYPRLYSNFNLYQTGSTYTDYFAMGYGIASDAGGYTTASSQLDISTDLVFGQPTWYKTVVQNNVGGSRVVMQLYRSTDKENWTKIADRSVGNLGSNTYRFIFGDNWILSFGGFSNTANGACGLMDLSETYVTSKGRVIWQAFEPSTGSVEIDKGYYNTGSGEIWMPKSKYFLDTLADGQTLGWSNKLYAVTKNGQASARICEDTLTGDFQASHLLDTTVYLNYSKDLIIPAPIDETITLSYQNEAYNYNNVGSVTVDSSYVASGFASNKYLVIADGATGEVKPFPANSANTWEMVYKIKYSNATTNQRICGALNNTSLAQIVIGIDNHKLITWISSNGTNWNIASGTVGSTTLANNTDYWVKAVYDGSKYVISLSTNGTTYTTEITVNNSTRIFTNGSSFLIGNAEQSGYLRGSIYLKDCYININGERWWTPVVTPTAVKFSKGSLLDADTGVTYYLSSDTTFPLSSISLAKDRDYCYLINRSGHDTSEGVVWSSTNQTTTLSKKLMSYVYLNPAHTTVLGLENNSIGLEVSGTYTTNYGVQGSPVISSDYIASNFTTSNYLTIPYAFAQNAHSSGWIARARIKITQSGGYNPIFGGASGTYLPDMYIDSDNKVAMNLSSNGSAYDITGGEGIVHGTHQLEENVWYDVEFGWTGYNYFARVYKDGEEIYPNEILINSNTPIESTADTLFVGSRVGASFTGYIDLRHTNITMNNNTSWYPVTLSSPTAITVTPDKEWMYTGEDRGVGSQDENTVEFIGATSYLGNYSVNVSSLFSNSDTDTSAYLMWYQQENRLIATHDKYATTFLGNGSMRFTGYKLTCTDSTHTTIASLEKKGTLCRVYAAVGTSGGDPLPSAASITLYMTYDDYNTYQENPSSMPSTLYGCGYFFNEYDYDFNARVAIDMTLPSQLGTHEISVKNATYSPRYDRITAKANPVDWWNPPSEGEYIFVYVGDYYVIMPEPLNELPPPDNTDV